MFDVKVTKEEDKIVIKWQLQKIKIPISEIMDVTNDESYAGEDETANRIGYPYGTTDRIQTVLPYPFTSLEQSLPPPQFQTAHEVASQQQSLVH